MEMKTPYYIMKIYDKNNCVVETEDKISNERHIELLERKRI